MSPPAEALALPHVQVEAASQLALSVAAINARLSSTFSARYGTVATTASGTSMLLPDERKAPSAGSGRARGCPSVAPFASVRQAFGGAGAVHSK